jgi:hypothetical protein
MDRTTRVGRLGLLGAMGGFLQSARPLLSGVNDSLAGDLSLLCRFEVPRHDPLPRPDRPWHAVPLPRAPGCF